MKTPPLFVINLARSPLRKAKIQATLETARIPYEFVTAVDGQQLFQSTIDQVSDSNSTFTRIGRSLHRNEIGCCLSHLKIWEHIAENRIEKAVIMEDDLIVSPDFRIILEDSAKFLPMDWALINFAHDIAKPRKVQSISHLETVQDYDLCSFDGIVGRSGAYMITLKTAENLISNALPVRMPCDDLTGNPNFVGGRIYGLLPRPVMWDENLESDIWNELSMAEHTQQSRSGLVGLYRRIRNRLKQRLHPSE